MTHDSLPSPEALNVTRQHVHFQVDLAAHAQPAQVGGRQRVRDQVDREPGTLHVIDGQAHAVYRDRAFARNVPRQARRRLDRDHAIGSHPPHPRHGPHAIHVPAHEVPADPVRQAQRLLQVDASALFKSRGAIQRFRRHVGLEPACFLRHHGEAHAVHGDAVADRHVPECELAGVDGNSAPPGSRFDRAYPADRGNNAREHYTNLASTRISGPTIRTSWTLSALRPESSESSGSSNMPSALSPINAGAKYKSNSSTWPSRTNDPFRRKPASTWTSLISRRASSRKRPSNSTLPALFGITTTSAPFAFSAAIFALSSRAAKTSVPPPSSILAAGGVSSLLSTTTRNGWRVVGTSRTVSRGSSSCTVPPPVSTEQARARQ